MIFYIYINAKTNLSAKKEKKGENSWVFKKVKNARREKCFKKEEKKEQAKVGRLVMLAKKFRLPIQNWAKGKNKKFVSQKGNFFIAKIKDNDLNFSRLGLVISTRINKSAVKRNLLKRTIFNFVRLNKFFGVYGKDILLIILPTASHLEKTQIEKELLLFFKSLNQ